METAKRDKVKLLVRGLYDAQKLRIQLGLRIDRLVRDGIMGKEEGEDFFELPFSRFLEAEKIMAAKVWSQIKDEPIVTEWLSLVTGIGPRLSGLLVVNIYDISRFDTVSRLWAYAGLKVEDGRAVKRAKGQKANWNSELKTTAWKIAESLIKIVPTAKRDNNGPYRILYDAYKARIIVREVNRGSVIYAKSNASAKWAPVHYGPEAEIPAEAPKDPEWTQGRINNMALRYIAKRFLSHLWVAWRKLDGLEIRTPYCVEHMGHTSLDDPWDYVAEKEAVAQTV